MAADPTLKAETDRAAAGWLIRLGSPALDDVDRRAFRAWLDADPAHAAALDEARRLWTGLAGAASDVERSIRRRRRRRAFLALAACLLAALAGLSLRPGADYATAHGETATVTLADGSRLTLDGDSAADVEIDARLRRVDLHRGRAFFEVTPDAARPFVVSAGPVETAVLGTAFAVERRGDAVEVVVERGRVEVRADDAVELGPEQRVTAAGDRIGAPEPAALATALAWRRGLMVFEDRTLGEVAEELGRATGARLVIPQASVRALRLSGVFREDRPAAVLDAIESALGLHTARLGVATVIYR